MHEQKESPGEAVLQMDSGELLKIKKAESTGNVCE